MSAQNTPKASGVKPEESFKSSFYSNVVARLQVAVERARAEHSRALERHLDQRTDLSHRLLLQAQMRYRSAVHTLAYWRRRVGEP